MRFIDTAQVYGDGHGERLIAKVLNERGQHGGGGPVRVATKISPTDGVWPPLPGEAWTDRFPSDYLLDRVERSLRSLDAEVLDLVKLHTWNRAWNSDPGPLAILRELKDEGKILDVGISTPEHDQNALIDLIRNGWLDTIQIIYNIFEQEPAAELLPTAKKHNVGVIVRVVFDEGSLTGKFTDKTVFPEGDFRRGYFRGDRLRKTVKRVDRVREIIEQYPDDAAEGMPSVAIRFALGHPGVSTVIPGIRTVKQAELNCSTADQKPLSPELINALRRHTWRRADWYED